MYILKNKKIVTLVLFIIGCISLGNSQVSAEQMADPLKKVAIHQNLNNQLPMDAKFRDSTGKEVRLGDYFKKDKPVILNFVYYECPMLCKLSLNGLVRTLNVLDFAIDKEFDIVTISIDPGETPELAAAKKDAYAKSYHRDGVEGGWHFLIGDEATLQDITKTAGFAYVYDPESDEYAHAAAIMIATPEGKLARYIYGIEFSARDLKLALIDASKSKIGSIVDQVLLFCFHYNPLTGKYSFATMKLIQLLGIMTVVSIITFLSLDKLRGKR
ncbi:MAG: protein SCO1/2 [Candidatus Omnitrophota bacterium]